MLNLRKLLLRIILLLPILVVNLSLGCGGKSQVKKIGAPTPKIAPAVPFTIESKPDSPLALNDKYVVQKKEPASVLKDWKVKYTAPAEMNPNSVEWTIDGEKSNNNPWERTEMKVGTYSVKLTGKINGNSQSFERTISVSEVYSESFKLLTLGDDDDVGEYKTDKTYVHWMVLPILQTPKRKGMFMSGAVSKLIVAGNPAPINFGWGFVQSAEGSIGGIWQFQQIVPGNAFNPKVHPIGFKVPTVPTGTHDSVVKGSQLYHHLPFQIGDHAEVDDTPGQPTAALHKSFATAQIDYAIKSANSTDLKFTVWQVVVQKETKQYVPLKQQDWKLEWNTATDTKAKVEAIKAPAVPTTKAPDVTASGYKHTSDFKEVPIFQK